VYRGAPAGSSSLNSDISTTGQFRSPLGHPLEMRGVDAWRQRGGGGTSPGTPVQKKSHRGQSQQCTGGHLLAAPHFRRCSVDACNLPARSRRPEVRDIRGSVTQGLVAKAEFWERGTQTSSTCTGRNPGKEEQSVSTAAPPLACRQETILWGWLPKQTFGEVPAEGETPGKKNSQ